MLCSWLRRSYQECSGGLHLQRSQRAALNASASFHAPSSHCQRKDRILDVVCGRRKSSSSRLAKHSLVTRSASLLQDRSDKNKGGRYHRGSHLILASVCSHAACQIKLRYDWSQKLHLCVWRNLRIWHRSPSTFPRTCSSYCRIVYNCQ